MRFGVSQFITDTERRTCAFCCSVSTTSVLLIY